MKRRITATRPGYRIYAQALCLFKQGSARILFNEHPPMRPKFTRISVKTKIARGVTGTGRRNLQADGVDFLAPYVIAKLPMQGQLPLWVEATIHDKTPPTFAATATRSRATPTCSLDTCRSD